MTYNTYTGTNGSNTIAFQGDSVSFDQTPLTDPYSGNAIATLSGEKYANHTIYDGLAGVDILSMTSYADFFQLVDGAGVVMLYNVEHINGGFGDDIINMAHASVTYGDIVIRGGAGNDIILANAGNDYIIGGEGNDYINGGPGDDRFFFSFGDGSDVINETSGNDTIIFDLESNITWVSIGLTVSGNDLIIDFGTDVITIKNHFTNAGRVETLIFSDGSSFDLANYGINPTANNDAVSGNEDAIITGNVLANDVAGPGDTLVVVSKTFMTVKGGAVVLNANGSYSYEGAANFHGEDSFSYTVGDNNGGSASATVYLTVFSVNDDPIAVDGSFTAYEDMIFTGNFLTNNSDVDGDALTAKAETLTTSKGGTVTINANGTFSYVGKADYHGADSFVGKTLDGKGGSATETVYLSILSVNDNPVAVADVFNVMRNSKIVANVLTNDTDVDGDTLTAKAGTFSTAKGGVVVQNADGNLSYTAPDGYYGGDDTYEYTVYDGQGGQGKGAVIFKVTAPSSAKMGTPQNDKLKGGNGDDLIIGDNGNDNIMGGNGNDELDGCGGKDKINGGAGDDTIIGGPGNDKLKGGKGADTFVFKSNLDGRDKIKDFKSSQGDSIDLSAFKNLWFGDNKFNGEVGEVIYKKGKVSIDFNGNAKADFTIGLSKKIKSLDAFDFDF